MGWLFSYTLGSLAAALVVVRIVEFVTNPFFTAPPKVWRKLRFSSQRGRRERSGQGCVGSQRRHGGYD